MKNSPSRSSEIGIPAAIAAVLSNIDRRRPAVIEAARFVAARDRRPLLILGGPPGVGKSVAAAHAALHATLPGDEVAVWIAECHAAWFSGGEEVGIDFPYQGYRVVHAQLGERPASAGWVRPFDVLQAGLYDRSFWNRVRAPHILVLDELGGEPLDPGGSGLALIVNLLTEREAAGVKTICTTNASAADFAATYCQGPGARLGDRIRGSGVWFSVPGPSLRGQGNGEEPAP